MVCCAAWGCSVRPGQGRMMHRFPQDAQRRAVWTAKIRRLGWSPSAYSYLCSDHFDETQYERKPEGRKQLKPNAVPTVFAFSRDKGKKHHRSPRKRTATFTEETSPAKVMQSDHTYARNQNSSEPDDEADPPPEFPLVKHSGCQTDSLHKRSVGTQVSVRTLQRHNMNSACISPVDLQVRLAWTPGRQVRLARGAWTPLAGGRLYYTGPSQCYMRLVIMSEEERRAVLNECHNQQGTGTHRGVRGTRDRVVAGYYWHTITRDVTDWVRRCPPCQLNDPIKTVAPVLHPIKADSQPESPLVRHTGCQTDSLHKRSVGTQLSMRTLQRHNRNSGTRTILSCKNLRLDTTTGPLSTSQALLMIATPMKLSRPAKRPHRDLKEEEDEDEEASVTVTI
ncbi:uncharacterized protein LOC130129645 [Lampris incognitus]|uniref:uncharacterized protein LOC130129645 n=1 Tax=Lampris incognitus TaxID=2546036 RepID=UPI0024B58B23|nr:uncharacterized protein LOC130129645 [Lampris incognitus]